MHKVPSKLAPKGKASGLYLGVVQFISLPGCLLAAVHSNEGTVFHNRQKHFFPRPFIFIIRYLQVDATQTQKLKTSLKEL